MNQMKERLQEELKEQIQNEMQAEIAKTQSQFARFSAMFALIDLNVVIPHASQHIGGNALDDEDMLPPSDDEHAR